MTNVTTKIQKKYTINYKKGQEMSNIFKEELQ